LESKALSKKKVTFEQICKKWSTVVKAVEKEGGRFTEEVWEKILDAKLDITDPARCIVGEAHGFKSDYCNRHNSKYCSQCVSYSTELASKRSWEIGIPEFVKHWNAKHSRKQASKQA
jgi:hypothetical protein